MNTSFLIVRLFRLSQQICSFDGHLRADYPSLLYFYREDTSTILACNLSADYDTSKTVG